MSNLARFPYRSAAIVEPDPVEVKPIELPKLPGYNDRECMSCGAAFRTQWTDDTHRSTKWHCMGKFRWWQRKCHERRPHMHLVCKECGAQWITAPQNAARFVE